MFIPFGEFAPDQSDHNKNIATQADNCIPVADTYGPLNDIDSGTQLGTTFPAHWGVALIDPGQGSPAYKYIYMAESGRIYKDNTTEIQSVTGSTFALNYGNPFTAFGSTLIIAGSGVTPQKIDISDLYSATNTTSLSDSPPKAACCATVRDFVVLGGVFDVTFFYNRIVWSGFNNPDQWTAGTNQSDSQDLKDSSKIQAIIGGDEGIIFQEKSITRMTYIGEPVIFQFDQIEGAKGTIAARSVVQVGYDIYYLAQDGFYVLRNGAQSVPIGENKINQWFFDNLGSSTTVNEDNLYRGICGSYDPKNNIIIWAFPGSTYGESTGQGFLKANKLLIYNIDNGRFSTGGIDDVLGLFSTPLRFNNSTDVYIDFSIGILKSDSGTGSKAHFLTGSPLAATVETGEISQGVNRSKLSTVRPIIDGTATVTVSAKDSASDTYTDSSATALDSTGKANFRTDNRYHRIKCTTSGAFTQAEGVEVELNPSGKR